MSLDLNIKLGGCHRHLKFVLILLGSSWILGDLPTTIARTTMMATMMTNTTNESTKRTNTVEDSSVCKSTSCKVTAERMIKCLNEKQDPCEDFYEFACGGWPKANLVNNSQFTSQQTAISKASITILNILDGNTTTTSSAVNKAQKFYKSCLRKDDKNEAIPKILKDIIKEIGGWHILPDTLMEKQKFDIQKVMLKVNNKCHDNPLLFHWDKRLEDFNLIITKKGIYNSNDSTIIDKLLKICRMMGANESEARAQFFQTNRLREELSDIIAQSDAQKKKSYELFTLQEWQNAAPFLNWSEFLNGVFSSPNFTILYNGTIYVEDAEYFHRLGEVITKYNKTEEGQKTFVNFMMWHLTFTLFDYLNDSYKAGEPTEAFICNWETMENFRAPIITLFVRETFTNKTKSEVQVMSKNTRHAYKEILKKAVWMNAATQQAVLERIDSIHESIGFPDYIMNIKKLDGDFEGLLIDPARYYHNKMALYQFQYLKHVRWSYAYLVNKIYKEDSSIIIPSLVGKGANYEEEYDLFLIPASIMQLPVYNDNNPMNFNYGVLATIIGHELTHAIWPIRKRDWISREDETGQSHMSHETDCIIDQYTNYTINGMHLNGTNTWAEDIADNVGLKASFNAYLDYSKNANVNYTLPGVDYNHRQQFFISFAQTLCRSYDDDQLEEALKTDEHSISKYRVIGALSNSKEFSEEFNCPVGSKMNPEKKCTLF